MSYPISIQYKWHEKSTIFFPLAHRLDQCLWFVFAQGMKPVHAGVGALGRCVGAGERDWFLCSKSILSSHDLHRNKNALCEAVTWETWCDHACCTHQHRSLVHVTLWKGAWCWWVLLLLNAIVSIMTIYIWLHSTPVWLMHVLQLWCHLSSPVYRTWPLDYSLYSVLCCFLMSFTKTK